MAKFVLDKIENIVGKEENAGYQHFLLFPHCFQKAISVGSLEVGIVWERVNESILMNILSFYVQNFLHIKATLFLIGSTKWLSQSDVGFLQNFFSL